MDKKDYDCKQPRECRYVRDERRIAQLERCNAHGAYALLTLIFGVVLALLCLW